MVDAPQQQNTRRLLIDGTKLADPVSDGIRRYVSGLLRAMETVAEQRTDWQVDVHVGTRIIPLAQIGSLLDVPKQRTASTWMLLRDAFEGIRMQLPMFGRVYDVVHLTMPNTFSAFRKINGPRLVTVHDVSHLACPQWQAETNSRTLQHGLGDAVERNATFTAVSEFTRTELRERCDISVHSVTGAGCDRNQFHANHSVEDLQTARQKHALPSGPFLLSVGTLEPRKNLVGTVRAFVRLVESDPNNVLDLVIAGRYGWGDLEDVRNAAAGCDRIHWLGYVPDEDLPLIYCQAAALSYVSHYEGFGLPALEAMNCGVPVIYGADTAVAEVVDSAGWAADPDSIEQICECFRALSRQANRRDEKSRMALRRSEKFDWKRVAEAMWETYAFVADRQMTNSVG